jgi:hypothetical protein
MKGRHDKSRKLSGLNATKDNPGIPPFGKGRLGGIFIMKKLSIKSPLSPLCQREVLLGHHVRLSN